MEKTPCPKCGAQYYIKELLYFTVKDIDEYRVKNDSLIVEKGAKKIETCFVHKCLSCGYSNNEFIKHS